MKNADNPRGLEGEKLEQLHALRGHFGHVIGEWCVRWQNHAVVTVERGNAIEIAQALGTIEGYVLALGEIVTPPQAQRFGKMTHALAAALTKLDGSAGN